MIKAYLRILRDYLEGAKATGSALLEFLIGLLWLTLPITFWLAWPTYRGFVMARKRWRK